MSSQAYGTNNDERNTTKRKFHGAFPSPYDFPSSNHHGGAIGRDAAPFYQSQNHFPAPPTAGMANPPNVANYNPAFNGQFPTPNSYPYPQPYPHPPMPYNYPHNNPAAMNYYPPQPPQMWGGAYPPMPAPYTFVQQRATPSIAPLLPPKISPKTGDKNNTPSPSPPNGAGSTKTAIRREPRKSQKPDSQKMSQSKSTEPALTTQSDTKNRDEGEASKKRDESKDKPSDQSLPSQNVENQAKELKKSKETNKNGLPPLSLPPVVIARDLPHDEKIDESSVAFAFTIGDKKGENRADAAESKWKSQQSLETTIVVTPSPNKKKTTANGTKTPLPTTSMPPLPPPSSLPSLIPPLKTAPKPKSHRNVPVEVFYGPAPELPPGWILQKLRRTGGKTKGGVDRYWYSPARKRFRSKVELRKYAEALQMTGGDENAAFKLFKKGGITLS